MRYCRADFLDDRVRICYRLEQPRFISEEEAVREIKYDEFYSLPKYSKRTSRRSQVVSENEYRFKNPRTGEGIVVISSSMVDCGGNDEDFEGIFYDDSSQGLES